MGKNGVTGIIIPLDEETINRVLHHRPIVPMFVEKFPSDIEPGDRAFLFVRGGARILDAEGEISSAKYEQVVKVRLYRSELCLSSEELDEYVASSGKSETDELLVLKLDLPTKYVRPMKCSLEVPKDGLYMTADLFLGILRENQ